MIKIRLIESEYKLIALLYLWTDVSLRYIREDFNFDNLSYEESKIRKKLSKVAAKVLTEIKEDMQNDYMEFFKNEKNLEKYNHQIDNILFGNTTEIS
ncbi:MAG: hypothetical protein Q8O20_05415 [Sulfuricurvum sp.]|uniref:hypothetical protein n=1 Tax=Sulfuricurvum sp. TaxID=2025608 RepID=UPI002735B23B|nr:hypothetical protein [Sulfuricurvum sp.]MDP2850495.1 hypothetical protein [Sulfuricurvum sp.]